MASWRFFGRGGRVAFAVFIAITLQAGAASVSQNDAGSGMDAPDVMEDALRLPGTGTFRGNFTSEDVRDWYMVKLKQARHDPVCVASTFVSEALVDGRVAAVSGDDVHEVVGRAVPLRTNYRAVTSDGFTGGFLRASPQSSPATLLGYDFTLTARGPGELPLPDAGTGEDAGNTKDAALAFPSACISGTLDPAAGDDADVYSFSGQMGDKFVFSLVDTTSTSLAQLHSSSGTLIAETLEGGLGAVTLPATDTYYVTTSSSSASSYVLALCGPDCGPPERPCEPMCVTLLESETSS